MWKVRWMTTFQKTRPVQCYLYLLIWILIFTFGLYWFVVKLGKRNGVLLVSKNSGAEVDGIQDLDDGLETFQRNEELAGEGIIGSGFRRDSSQDVIGPAEEAVSNSNPIIRLCNPTELISEKEEYLVHSDLKLEGLILLFRHGDRGPLSHAGRRNVSHINCFGSHSEYPDFVKYANDGMGKLNGYSQFIGSFHNYPKVPIGRGCSLGQLTTKGAIQLLTLGKAMRRSYESLFQSLSNNESYWSIGNLKVIAYSTRYRRTFQSLIAFLYGLLGPEDIVQSVRIRESQSTAFCFNDCSCRSAEGLKKTASKKALLLPKDKFEMAEIVTELNFLLELGKAKKTGSSLLDSLLLYACHETPLPCRQKVSKVKKNGNRRVKIIPTTPTNHKTTDCITQEKLRKLIDLIELENQSLKGTREYHQYSLLSSYGLIREILNLALRMTNSGISSTNQQNPQEQTKSRFAVFSGHDKTLQSLLGALGIVDGHPDLNLPPYASRFVIEIYRKSSLPDNSPRKHFLRFLYNGISVTHLVGFCQNSLEVVWAGSEELCPLERLVRFFHDSYFDPFRKSVVNFKDACQ